VGHVTCFWWAHFGTLWYVFDHNLQLGGASGSTTSHWFLVRGSPNHSSHGYHILQTFEPIILHDCLVYWLTTDSPFLRCQSKAIKRVIYLATVPYFNGKNPPSLCILTCTCTANVRFPRRNQKPRSCAVLCIIVPQLLKQSWFGVQKSKHGSWRQARTKLIHHSHIFFLPNSIDCMPK